jgi:ring-1,2-phenylacetyl-CoA epoxidase subunit PaaD
MVRDAADRPDRHPSGTQRTCRTGPVQPARAEEKAPASLGPARSDLVRQIAGSVPDPELPMVTVADLGILRDVTAEGDRIVVSITPTFSGCPAMAEIRADLHARLADAGVADVEIRTVLSPPWSTEWISAAGRRKLAAAGIAPPAAGPASRSAGPVPLTLATGPARAVPCPACGSAQTERTAAFGATACKDLYRCRACAEPFEHIKEI